MGFSDTSLLCKTVFILLILCFVIELIEFAISYWFATEYTVSSVNIKNNGGLWIVCYEPTGYIKTCENYNASTLPGLPLSDKNADWFKAVQAFSILSWVFFLAAVVLVIVFMFFLSNKKILYLVTVCLSFAGAFCALIAFAVYAGKKREISPHYDEYSASFALTIISFILGLISGILGILDYLGFVGGKKEGTTSSEPS